jgi:hypothetical protein
MRNKKLKVVKFRDCFFYNYEGNKEFDLLKEKMIKNNILTREISEFLENKDDTKLVELLENDFYLFDKGCEEFKKIIPEVLHKTILKIIMTDCDSRNDFIEKYEKEFGLLNFILPYKYGD